MRTLLLENDPPDLVDKIALRIAEQKFTGFELWAWFGRSMREDRDAGVARLLSLETGDAILMRHVFAHGFGQMEGMLSVLGAMADRGTRIGVWMVGSVKDDLINYIDSEWEGPNDPAEKSKMVVLLKRVLDHHDVRECWDDGLSSEGWHDRQERVTSESLAEEVERRKAKCRHTSRSRQQGGGYVCMGCGKSLDG